MKVRAAVIVLAVVGVAVTACNDDGRTMRPAEPGQNASVSTLAPVTEPSVEDTFAPATSPATSPATTVAATPTSGPVAAGGELVVTSSAFAEGGPIPAQYTCQGDNVSPDLSWSAAPAETVEIAITMVDLDAPDFVHWAIAALDPASTSLGAGVVPEFAIEGTNGTGQVGYTGPCPPPGETHQYRITVHYLTEQTELGDGAAGADLAAAIDVATLDSASITGTYSQS
jgi:Raf kinase inhibitor-like YbhB/YbcL family protein